MNYVEEAIGIVRAAEAAGMPVAISFTVETDGRLPTGQTLRAAIEQVERDHGYAAYYMINCAHPTHFAHVLVGGEPWAERIRGTARERVAPRATPSWTNRRRSTSASRRSSAAGTATKRALPAHERDRRMLRHGPSPRRSNRGNLFDDLPRRDLTAVRRMTRID